MSVAVSVRSDVRETFETHTREVNLPMGGWFYVPANTDAGECGPLQLDDLVALLVAGTLSEDTYVRAEGSNEYVEADCAPEVAARLPLDVEGITAGYTRASEGPPGAEMQIREKVRRMVRCRPESGWHLILALVSRAPSDSVLAEIAAGPLEDLLVRHGDNYIGQIEDEARRSEQFRRCLSGVWRNKIPDAVWSRVVAVVGKS